MSLPTILYDPRFNISLLGFEKLHPFDSKKYGNIFETLRKKFTLAPVEWNASKALAFARHAIERHHSADFIRSLGRSSVVAAAMEVPPAALLPACLLESTVLKPMALMSAGTIVGAFIALQKGVCISLGGGFHHASRSRAHGFCIYADIPMAVEYVFDHAGDTAVNRAVERILVIDLDAHQGDGVEIDLQDRVAAGQVHIFDAYRPGIFPNDAVARRTIGTSIHYDPDDSGAAFLDQLRRRLPDVLRSFQPHLVIYNAGTDTLAGDPVSGLGQTADSIVERDEFVFRACWHVHQVPILMVLSGGYQKVTAPLVARSITNLHDKFAILNSQTPGPQHPRPLPPLIRNSVFD